MHVDCDDALCWLRGRPPAEADAVITDPPYSSGGLFRSDRGRPPSEKYQQDKTIVDYGEFSGDAKDGRSWTSWCAEWLDLCRRAVKPGGYVLSFVDWRQLPSLTDAFQWSGLVWRGIVAWDKGRGHRTKDISSINASTWYGGRWGDCRLPSTTGRSTVASRSPCGRGRSDTSPESPWN